MKKILYRKRKLIRKGPDVSGPKLQFSNFRFPKAQFLFSIFILLMIISACETKQTPEQHEQHSEATTYTCPMHPQIVEKEPGSCPICGMDLVRQSAEGGGEIALTDDLGLLIGPADQLVISGIRTVNPVQDQKTVVSSFPGEVAYDTRQSYSLPIRVGGRIEKLYVRYNFQPVKKGQKLLEIYSPELLTAQRELLFLLESDPENDRLIEAAKQKLRLLGVNEAQIRQLTLDRNEQYSFPVYSPYNGYVVEAQANNPEGKRRAPAGSGMSAGMGGGGMNGGGSGAIVSTGQANATAELSLQEGMYVASGQPLFRIIDASSLWAEFNVSASEASLIQEGDPLEISWGPGEEQHLQAEVDFIQPFFSQGENFSKIRVNLKNNDLRVGQLVEGQVRTQTSQALWIPALAVLDVGNRKLVFVKEEGVLKPKEVVTGIRAGEMVEVQEGLSQEDAIAHNAQFLIDSEGFVR